MSILYVLDAKHLPLFHPESLQCCCYSKKDSFPSRLTSMDYEFSCLVATFDILCEKFSLILTFHSILFPTLLVVFSKITKYEVLDTLKQMGEELLFVSSPIDVIY